MYYNFSSPHYGQVVIMLILHHYGPKLDSWSLLVGFMVDRARSRFFLGFSHFSPATDFIPLTSPLSPHPSSIIITSPRDGDQV